MKQEDPLIDVQTASGRVRLTCTQPQSIKHWIHPVGCATIVMDESEDRRYYAPPPLPLPAPGDMTVTTTPPAAAAAGMDRDNH